MGNHREINVFLTKIFAFYLFWLLADNWLSHEVLWFNKVWTYFYHILLIILRFTSETLLTLLNYEFVSNYNSLAIVGTYGVIIGNHCLAFGLIYSFTALIISYPGPWKRKVWFIPLGILIILIANTIRITTLTIGVVSNDSTSYTMEQHDFFNNIVYVLIFLMWMIWIRFDSAATKLRQ